MGGGGGYVFERSETVGNLSKKNYGLVQDCNISNA